MPLHHRVLVYPGNLHAANRREMFSLYVAVHILRRRGWGVTLLRTGEDFGPGLDVAFQHLRGAVSRELGRLPRREMLALLKLADVLVQPGPPDAFNQRRLPSKLPEFLAAGRPVVLPRANLGLRLCDGREAVLLDHGHGLEIAAKVDALFREPERAEAIGAAGRAFAEAPTCAGSGRAPGWRASTPPCCSGPAAAPRWRRRRERAPAGGGGGAAVPRPAGGGAAAPPCSRPPGASWRAATAWASWRPGRASTCARPGARWMRRGPTSASPPRSARRWTRGPPPARSKAR